MKILQFIQKYEFWFLILIAVAMCVADALFGYEGLGGIGTIFFLVAITSFSMKEFMKRKNQ